MNKPRKTATELENMIGDELLHRNECPYGTKVSVKRLGASWTALTLATDPKAYGGCITGIARIVDELKKSFDLAD